MKQTQVAPEQIGNTEGQALDSTALETETDVSMALEAISHDLLWVRRFAGGNWSSLQEAVQRLKAVEGWLATTEAPPNTPTSKWSEMERGLCNSHDLAGHALQATLHAYARTIIEEWLHTVDDLDSMISDEFDQDRQTAYHLVLRMRRYFPLLQDAIRLAERLAFKASSHPYA